MSRPVTCLACVSLFTVLLAAQPPQISTAVRPFVSVDAPVVALTHVRVIDGTGCPRRADQTILIKDGNIAALGDTGKVDRAGGGHDHRPVGQERDSRSRDGPRAPLLSHRTERLRTARRELRRDSTSPAA